RLFFFSSRRRHTRFSRDWSSDVCSSDLTPFGPGAMLTVPGGTSVVIAGLDFWFEENSSDENYDPTEFDISEWRLERLLDVDCLQIGRASGRERGKVAVGEGAWRKRGRRR